MSSVIYSVKQKNVADDESWKISFILKDNEFLAQQHQILTGDDLVTEGEDMDWFKVDLVSAD